MYDPGTLYSDPILTNFSVGYQDQRLYADRIFPTTPVSTQSGRYRVYDRSDWLIYPSRREPGTVANEISGRKWSEDSFFTKEHSLQAPIYDEEREQLNSLGGFATSDAGAGLDINPEQDATELVMRSLLLEREQKVAAATRDAANYPVNHVTTLAGAAKWSDYTGGSSSTSNPVTDLRTAVLRIRLDTGQWPNTLAIPFDAVGVIENHPRVTATFRNFSLMIPDAWRVLLGLPEEVANNIKVMVVDSKYNAADNIDLAEDIQSFWGQDVWMGIVNQDPGQLGKTFGKTFVYPYGGNTRPTDRWREPQRKADLVRTSYRYDVKVVSGVAGYLFKNAVAALT